MDWNDNVIAEFRAGKPRVADMFDLDALVLLHTTGAKSGHARTSPVAAFDVDGDTYVIASAAGAPKHPSWYANLVAHPQIEVERWRDGELRTESVTAQALTGGPERDEIWNKVVAMAPGFGEYQTKTSRVIPVVRLAPR